MKLYIAENSTIVSQDMFYYKFCSNFHNNPSCCPTKPLLVQWTSVLVSIATSMTHQIRNHLLTTMRLNTFLKLFQPINLYLLSALVVVLKGWNK